MSEPTGTDKVLLQAAADSIECVPDGEPLAVSLTTSGPNETTALCVIVALVDRRYTTELMLRSTQAVAGVLAKAPTLTPIRPKH